MPLNKIKQANKKFKHEQKRRQKARLEKMRVVRMTEAKAKRKHAQLDYVRSLGAELEA